MTRELVEIIEALGYKKIERLRQASGVLGYGTIQGVLTASIRGSYAMLFFPGIMLQVSPFGMNLSIHLVRNSRSTNHIMAFPELNEKFMRTLFTGFEAIVFIICHIVLEQHRHDYTWEKERTRQRIARLNGLICVDDWSEYIRLFDEFFHVRDAFAHSFVDLEKIRYKSNRLGVCFGDTYLGKSMREAESAGASIFMDDVQKVFAPIMSLFERHQLEQFDKQKLYALCDQLLAERSLGPGF